MAQYVFNCRIEFSGAQILVEADSVEEAREKADAGDGDIVTDGAEVVMIKLSSKHPTMFDD